MARDDLWPPADDELVEKLWAEGLSMSLIGERMKRTKGSVVGRVHRLNLPARPSPIREKRKQRVAPPATTQRRQEGTGLLVGPTLAPLTLPGLRLMAAVVKAGPVSACCWPLGDPRTPGFRFCGDPATNRSYCAAHHALAYVPTRRQEVADAA